MKKNLWKKKGIGFTMIATMGMLALFSKTGITQVWALEYPVEINEENFQNDLLLTMANYYDSNHDGYLSEEESKQLTSNVTFRGGSTPVKSVKGIEYFPEFIGLSTPENDLDGLDVSFNTKLISLTCSSNKLNTLDVSKNTALTYLDCSNNELSSLNVSNNLALENLRVWNNEMSSLDVSNNLALKYLNCSDNHLSSLDVSDNLALEYLDCSNNHLSSLDVSRNSALSTIICTGNQISVALYKEENGDCYVDFKDFLTGIDKVDGLSVGNYDNTTGRLELENSLQVGDSFTYDYTIGHGDDVMTVTVEISKVQNVTASSDTEEILDTESPKEEVTPTEQTEEKSGSTSDQVATASSAVVTSTVDEQKDTPKTGDTALPVWIGILGILGMVNYLVARKKRG